MNARMEELVLVGRGLTADVYEWGTTGAGQVVKLFRAGRSLEKVEREFAITRAVREAGVRAPQAFEVVELSGRLGIVFERVKGRSMLKEVERKPWTLLGAAKRLAEWHAELHGHEAPGELPGQRAQMEDWIATAEGMPERLRQEARICVERMRDGNAICHGDFHPENILMGENGPVVIDWSGGTRGEPLADVARTSALMQRANLPAGTPLRIRWMFGCARRLLHRTYLKRYLELRGGTWAEIEQWTPVQVAVKYAWWATRER